VHELQRAASYGLEPDDYAAADLARSAAALAAATATHPTLAARFEVGLSAAALHLLSDLHYGRVDPAAAGFHLQGVHAPLDLAAALESLAGAHDLTTVLTGVEPPFYHYQLLKLALARYLVLAEDPSLTSLPAPPAGLRSGASRAGALAPTGLPEAHAAVVEVHEVRLRIEADTATAHAEGELAQPAGGESGQAHVDRAPPHVQAVLGHPARAAAQRRVGLRRAITADHLVGVVATGERLQVGEDIEYRGFDRMNLTGAKITQEVIEPRQLGRLVLPVLKVDARQPLTGMRVHQGQGAPLRGAGPGRRQRQEHERSTSPLEEPPSGGCSVSAAGRSHVGQWSLSAGARVAKS